MMTPEIEVVPGLKWGSYTFTGHEFFVYVTVSAAATTLICLPVAYFNIYYLKDV